jgi:hypothetical protein
MVGFGPSSGRKHAKDMLTVNSVLMLVTFQMCLLALKAKRNHDLRIRAMTEKSWRADDTYARAV